MIGVALEAGFVANATMVSPVAPKELFALAGYVFSGTVASVHAERMDGTIVSNVVFRDLHVVKGPSQPDSLVLTLDGGIVGNDLISVDGQPQFTIDERYIVFVSQDLGSGGYHMPVLGLWQGCYSVRNDSTVWSGGGWPVVGLTPEQVTVAVPDSLRPIPEGKWMPEQNQYEGPWRIIPERQTLGKRMREAEFLEIVGKFSELSEGQR
jgi:hypothetical protein